MKYLRILLLDEAGNEISDDLTLTHRQLIAQENNYYPFGMEMVGTGFSENEDKRHRYGYNGKEEIAAFGLQWQDYGARNYDGQLGRMLSIDPMAEILALVSPYNYVLNNPITFADPTGMFPEIPEMGGEEEEEEKKTQNVDGHEIEIFTPGENSNYHGGFTAPIYNESGEFLGTDDEGFSDENGVKHRAIVMKESDFTQGMSHSDAIAKNLGKEGLKNEKAYERLKEHWDGLDTRPDFDGIVTVAEAQQWRKDGNGAPLYVDISKFQFQTSWLTVNDIGANNTQTVNFFRYFNIHWDNDNVIWRPASNHTLSRVYGTLRITLLNRQTGEVTVRPNRNGFIDTYDFAGWRAWVAGAGSDFGFIGYGNGIIFH